MSRARPFVLFAIAGLGCQAMNTPLYFNGDELETVGGMNGERVKGTVTLLFRRPSDSERSALDMRRQQADPVKVPWVSRDNVHLQVSYVVKNLGTETAVFNVSVDGATEYIKYDEDMVATALGGDDPVFLPLMQLTPHMLAAGASYQGLFREDDFVEAESDLDAIDQFMAPFAAVLINRSDVNPIGLEMVVPNTVVPAMVEIDVTLTANQPMSLQYLVRVRDDEDQLLHETTDRPFTPTPALFAPMTPPP